MNKVMYPLLLGVIVFLVCTSLMDRQAYVDLLNTVELRRIEQGLACTVALSERYLDKHGE